MGVGAPEPADRQVEVQDPKFLATANCSMDAMSNLGLPRLIADCPVAFVNYP